MERKHKIWLTVLLILLIAAIAGVVYLNKERTESNAQLASTNAMLEEERGKYLTLEEALADATTQSEQLTSEKEALEAELETVNASLAEAQASLEQAQTELASREEDLTRSKDRLPNWKRRRQRLRKPSPTRRSSLMTPTPRLRR